MPTELSNSLNEEYPSLSRKELMQLFSIVYYPTLNLWFDHMDDADWTDEHGRNQRPAKWCNLLFPAQVKLFIRRYGKPTGFNDAIQLISNNKSKKDNEKFKTTINGQSSGNI